MHYECRYCDTGFYPVEQEGDKVCVGCGAEWEGAKILVEDEVYDEDYIDDYDYEDDFDIPDDRYDCGCCKCCGCSCLIDWDENEDYEEDVKDCENILEN